MRHAGGWRRSDENTFLGIDFAYRSATLDSNTDIVVIVIIVIIVDETAGTRTGEHEAIAAVCGFSFIGLDDVDVAQSKEFITSLCLAPIITDSLDSE